MSESKEVIPDDAVEAAEAVLIAHQRRDNSSCLCGWAKLGLSHPLHQAFLVLEAAAPHMLAGPHPTMSSEVTAANNAHIAICPQCRETFG